MKLWKSTNNSVTEAYSVGFVSETENQNSVNRLNDEKLLSIKPPKRGKRVETAVLHAPLTGASRKSRQSRFLPAAALLLVMTTLAKSCLQLSAILGIGDNKAKTMQKELCV